MRFIIKRNPLSITFALSILVTLLGISYIEGAAKSSKSDITSKSSAKARAIEPRISFEKKVCDLGDVGPGTKNECEFRFINNGRGLLKIGKISRTCGCTAFHLDKKQYPPNETGTIKVIYTAAKSTTTRNVLSRLKNSVLLSINSLFFMRVFQLGCHKILIIKALRSHILF